jgi:hypothetical protein
MFKGIIKLGAAVLAVAGPFAGGQIVTYTVEPEAAAFFAVAGVLFGLAGLFVFASIERGETAAHRRALNGREN